MKAKPSFLAAALFLAATSGAWGQSILQFAATIYDVVEGAGAVTLPVQRTDDTTTTASVDYETADVTATNGLHYIATNGTLTFAAGETNQTIVVPILNEGFVEGSRTFQVNLTNPTNALLGSRTNATVRRADNDVGLQTELATWCTVEGQPSVQLRVLRGDDGDFPVTVDYTTADGTAKAGVDYTGTNDTLSFAAGDGLQLVTVQILNDGLKESSKTFTLRLTNSTGSPLGTRRSTTVTIVDNDPGVHFEPTTRSGGADHSYARVAESEGTVVLTVVRGNDLNLGPITVDFATSDVTATNGLDYVATNGTLRFAQGDLAKTFAVPILDDGVPEADERFQVTLSNVTGDAALGLPSATVTIANDDLGVHIVPNTCWVAENDVTLALKVVRANNGNLGPFTVDFATSDVTATNGLDYVATNGTLRFVQGEMTKTLAVPILRDEVPEGDEQFQVTLSNVTGDAALDPQYFRATVTIEEAVSALEADPRVAQMVEAVQLTDLVGTLRQLTGEEALLVGGEAYVLTNRLTTAGTTAPIWKATQFVHDHLRSLDLEVQFHRWDSLFQIPAGSCWYTNVNVIGTQPGQSRSNEFVLIIAHLDDIIPPYVNIANDARAAGADDNASGVAAVLTAARIFSQYRFDRTLQFILFTGEEGPTALGSSIYAVQARAEGRNIAAVLDLDMIGSESALPPRCLLVSRSEPSNHPDFPLAYTFMYVVRTYGLEDSLWPVRSYAGYASDQKSFWNQGYAATCVSEYSHDSYPCYHTPEDTLRRLNLPFFSAAVRAAVGTLAHLAGVVGERPLGILEVANSDWSPGSGIGGGSFYARHETEANEAAGDPRDIAWADRPPNPNQRWLSIHTAPHGVALQTDARPLGSESIFQAKLTVGDATGTGVSCSNRLRFTFRTPPAADRIYLARIHVDGRYVQGGADFDCVTNLQTVVAGGGFVELPALHQVPDGEVYGTCDVAARFWNTNSSSCHLRPASVSERSAVLMATAQVGTHLIDALEVNTNLGSSAEWTLVRSYTNYVSPDATHFDTGWTELAREFDPARLPVSDAHFFRIKRIWVSP
jgi:hypothetical protein